MAQYNDMATIFLSSRENSILSLVEHPHAFKGGARTFFFGHGVGPS